MKSVICLLSVLSCSLALPSPHVTFGDAKGENVYIKPIANYTGQQVSSRIVGGKEVIPNSRPYQVAIFIDGRSFCGGSLISDHFVLTAAHCTIHASFVQLHFGAHNIGILDTKVLVTSTSIINHPDYQAQNLVNDIALVRSPRLVETNDYIQTIGLPPPNADNFAGASAILTGWGRISDKDPSASTVLRELEVEILSNAVCSNSYGPVIRVSNMCTSGAGVVGGCNGDSGGPLVVGSLQVGVASFVSDDGCESGLPTGYARVSYFKDWIAANSDVPLI